MTEAEQFLSNFRTSEVMENGYTTEVLTEDPENLGATTKPMSVAWWFRDGSCIDFHHGNVGETTYFAD